MKLVPSVWHYHKWRDYVPFSMNFCFLKMFKSKSNSNRVNKRCERILEKKKVYSDVIHVQSYEIIFDVLYMTLCHLFLCWIGGWVTTKLCEVPLRMWGKSTRREAFVHVKRVVSPALKFIIGTFDCCLHYASENCMSIPGKTSWITNLSCEIL